MGTRNKPFMFGMSKLQIGILSCLSLFIVAAALCLAPMVYTTIFPGRPIFRSTATPTNPPIPTKDVALWVVYEVVYTQEIWTTWDINTRKSVTITWLNNTGGTNQGDYAVGDGKQRSVTLADGTTINLETVTPFRIAYSTRFGEFVSLLAQSGENRGGGLECNIYLTNKAGAECLVNNKSCSYPYPGKWKSSFCEGQFCVCDVSGTVGR